MILFDINERVCADLLCFVVTLEQDVEHPHLQSGYHEGRVASVSMKW